MPPPGGDRAKRPRRRPGPERQGTKRQGTKRQGTEREGSKRRGGREGGFGPFRKDDDAGRGAPRTARPKPGGEREPVPPLPSRLRVVRGKASDRPPAPRGKKPSARRARPRPAPGRRRPRRPRDVRDEILSLGGRDGPRYYDQVARAADALARDHERDALRLLRPLSDALPDSPTVRELLGLALYGDGKFGAAARELEEFGQLTGSVDQHPVLMDCYRAQRRWRRVDDLWRELAATSPPADLATEGRIVAAGALADRDRVPEALAFLGRRGEKVSQPRDHHLRLWYALGDLEERAGNLPRARALFDRVRSQDPAFADVAERLAALG